jgi:hypothetical protein
VGRPASLSTSVASPPRTVGGGAVGQLTAMLQASMLKPPGAWGARPSSSGSAAGAVGDDSSDDEENPASRRQTHHVPKKLSTSASSPASGSMKWECDKANRFGLNDSRMVVLDHAAHSCRFFEKDKLKSEIPLNQIANVSRKRDESKRIEMKFKEDRRSYELTFKSEAEAADFENAFRAELTASAQSPSGVSRMHSASTAQRGSTPAVSHTPGHSISVSYNSSSTGSGPRDAAMSVAIQSDFHPGSSSAAGGGMASSAPAEDHNAYLDYLVTKKNRFGIRQPRILVINSSAGTMLLLDEKRKFKKEFSLGQILSVEIPKGDKGTSGEAQCYLVFRKEANQQPFNLFFADALDRLHFCERLIALAPHDLSIKDESSTTEEDESLRFGVLKINKVGVKKKRIVVLRPKEKVLRSFNREKSYKDVSFSKILRVEKPTLDRNRVNIFLRERPHPLILIFPDTTTRERFVIHANYIRTKLEEELIAAGEKAANVAPPPSGSEGLNAVVHSLPDSPNNPGLSIFIGSWNLGNAGPTYDSLADFIPSMKYDLYVIGLQECSKGHREQWLNEIRAHVQQSWNGRAARGTTAPAATAAVPVVGSPGDDDDDDEAPRVTGGDDSEDELPIAAASTPSSAASGAGAQKTSRADDDSSAPYALLGVVKLWEIVLMVLIRRPLAARVSNICMDTIATGVGDVLGNKGGCGISFSYCDTNLAFVATHLAARAERVVQRRENYMKILKQLQLGTPGVDILQQMDHVFWLGGE